MAKPTILQSLLGRPSQTYYFPQEKAYHSTKQDMLRIATETSGDQAVSPANVTLKTAKPVHGVRAFDNTQLLISDPDDDRGNDEDNDDDSEGDVFYTPNTSPRTSMASTLRAPLKPPSPSPPVPSTKTSFTHVNTSTTSISSSALDSHSLFSLSSSDSTRMTTPVQSDSEQHLIRNKTNHEPPQIANGHIKQEWAKDVRWLVPSTAVKATTTPRKRQSTPVEAQTKTQTRTKPNTSISKNISKMTPSIMSSMTALLEEDELQPSSSINQPPPRSSVIISPPRRSMPRDRTSSGPSSATHSNTRAISPPNSNVRRRRSRSLGGGSISHASSSSHQTSGTSASASSSSSSATHKSHKYASSSVDPYDKALTSLPTFTPGELPSHGTPGYTSLVLPRAPVPLSQTSHNPKGFFSLLDSNNGADVNGKVDLTRNGVAQTTMASVEVVRGLSGGSSLSANKSSPSKIMGLFRRSSTTASPPSQLSSAFGSPTQRERQKEPRHGKGREVVPDLTDLPLGFTSYRTPPTYVPSGSVLVQVWAVGIDGVDWRLVFGGNGGGSGAGIPARSNAFTTSSEPRTPTGTPPTTPKRSSSLRSTLGRFGGTGLASPRSVSGAQSPGVSSTPAAGVGYVPGRSFVGRVLECGWEVTESSTKKGDWVVGLLDLKKCGALTQFIVVDRHRVHRAPYPRMQENGLSSLSSGLPDTNASRSISDPRPSNSSKYSSSRNGVSSSKKPRTHPPSPLSRSQSKNPPNQTASPLLMSLEELALLPICGIPAYRAVRTFAFAFSDGTAVSVTGGPQRGPGDERGPAKDALEGTRRRRVLVLRGHDGAGAVAVQMLVRRGWRVCVHVPYACLPYEATGLAEELEETEGSEGDRRDEYYMRRVEERISAWGGEEVIFDDGEEGEGESQHGAVVRVIDQLYEDGDVFDAVLDTVGGREVWEASERLLKSVGKAGVPGSGGGSPNEKKGKTKKLGLGVKQFTTLVGDSPWRTIPSAGDNFKAGLRSLSFGVDGKKAEGKVGYAWVSHAQDVDWEGEDIRDTLQAVLRTFVDDGIRPWVGENAGGSGRTTKDRAIPFEKAPEIFISTHRGLLTDGGTTVVKVVG